MHQTTVLYLVSIYLLKFLKEPLNSEGHGNVMTSIFCHHKGKCDILKTNVSYIDKIGKLGLQANELVHTTTKDTAYLNL